MTGWGIHLLHTAVIAVMSQASMGQPRYEHDAALRRVNEGEHQLSKLKQYGQQPQYGKCWTQALEQIREGCKRLTDDEQSFLALSFANCHLQKAGLPTYPCDDSRSVSSCLHQLKGDTIAFNAYTEFFTHTQDICFFLQNQVWHEQTEETVSRLARSSEDVADKMEVTGQLQEEMIEKQGESLVQQGLILQNEEKLRNALQTSSQDIKNVFAEMKESTQSQKLLFEETFSRVAGIQRLILGEFTWFNSLLFFAAAVLIAYLLTSTPRTSSARLWLFVVLGADLVLERAVFQVTGTDQTLLYEQMWFIRKCGCTIAVVVLCVCAYRYKDFNVVNNQLLLEIRRQNSELCRTLKGIGANSYPSLGNNIAAAIGSSGVPAMSLVVQQHQTPMLGSGKDHSDGSMSLRKAESITRIDTFSSDDFTSSSDSNPTNTDTPSSDTDDVSDGGSFRTADPSSRQDNLEGRGGGYKTPINHSFHQTLNQSDATIVTGGSSQAKRKRGRPNRSKSRQSTPQNGTPTQSHYNLRTRYPVNANNSILNSESIQMFVERMGEALGHRRYRAERVEPAKHSRQRNITSFSSDDEY